MTIVMLSNIGEEDLVTFYRPMGESTDWDHKSTFKLTCKQEDLGKIDYTVRDFMLESKQVRVSSVYCSRVSSSHLIFTYCITCIAICH